MLFLAATTFLAYANMIICWSGFVGLIQGKRMPLVNHLHALTSFCFLIGFLLPVAQDGRALGTNWAVLAYFVLGAASAVLFSVRVCRGVRGQRDTSAMSWKSGIGMWAVLAGLYVAGATVDHWRFFSHDPANTGIASLEGLQVKSISCNGMVIVRMDGDQAVYRCPTSISFGATTMQPFYPWPAYTEGSSVELKRAIDRVMATAK